MKSKSMLVVAVCAWVASGCGPGEEKRPPPDLPAPVLERVAPNLIAAGGGTLVRVYGDNFQSGIELFVGTARATDVTWVNSRAFTARIPPGTPDTSVALRVVNPDQKSATLADGLRYDVAPSITNARMTMADPSEFFQGGEAVSAEIRGALFVPTRTGTAGVGPGQGIRAQVALVPRGASPPSIADFTTWIDARYESDSSTLIDWDVYKGVVALPPTSGRTMLEYYAVMRFSVDAGSTWVYADKDGSANGWSGAQLPRVRTGARRPEWCKANDIGANVPMTVTYSVGQTPNAVVRGQVHVSGVTNGPGLGAGVEMEIGYGQASVDPSMWTWSQASFKGDLFGANDEFQATLPNPNVAGTYRWTFRSSYAGGPYRYCDAGDNTEFSMERTNHLTVTGSTPNVIDWCKLGASDLPQPPPTETYAVTGPSDLAVRGLVFEQGVTDTTSPPSAALEVSFGYGPVSDQPSSGTWQWTNAAFVADRGNNDEFSATLPNPGMLGRYKFAMRARINAGAYAYCDADGLAVNGFTLDQAGNLSVVPQCRLAAMSAVSVHSGGSMTVDGTIDCATCADIVGEAGVGPRGSDASRDAGWAWSRPATLSAGTYRATIGPAVTGDRHVSFRFKTRGTGGEYFYCDADGNSVGRYTVAQQLALTVNKGTRATAIDYCATLSPATVPVSSVNAGTARILGQIWEDGLTAVAGAPAGVVAELGVGPPLEDPGVSARWSFSPAPWKQQAGNDDQFEGTIPTGTPAGHGYALRYSLNGGPWCYGDLDGNGGNVELNGFSLMTANNPPAPNIGRIQ